MEYILISLFVAMWLYLIGKGIFILLVFKKGHNPFTRICKKCDAVQQQMHMNYDHENEWWQEVAPGHDTNCKCRWVADNPLPGW